MNVFEKGKKTVSLFFRQSQNQRKKERKKERKHLAVNREQSLL